MAKPIVIIGNGIAGVTAARHLRKRSDEPITVISSESKYFFSRTALMYVFMGHMQFKHIKPYEDWFWKKNKIDLVFDHVESLDTDSSQLTLKSGSEIQFNQLIIATGSASRKLGCAGEDSGDVHYLYNLKDLDQLERNVSGKKRAVVIGGGLIGIELAEMLHSRGIQVDFVIRESSYWRDAIPQEESKLISKHVETFGINLHFDEEVVSINESPSGQVQSVSTKTGNTYACDLVCVAIGVSPNIAFLNTSGLEIDRGILVNEFLESNIPGIYAIGDCAQLRKPDPGRKAIEPVWYAGKIMGEVVASNVCGSRMEYHPGNWFNSAKFLNLEYQVYGHIPVDNEKGIEWFYWEDQAGEKSFRIAWHQNDKSISGILAIGLRVSHKVADSWISESKDILEAMEELEDLNFESEFSGNHFGKIRNSFIKERPHLSKQTAG